MCNGEKEMFKKLVLAVGLLSSMVASANVVIIGTRVIYPSDAKSVNIQLQNTSSSPSLVQAWVDEGNPDVAPNKSKAPFLITPPMVRVEGKAGQTLRLMFTGKGLPQDRESLYYFNLLDVPPKPKADEVAGKNYLQFAVRNRLKLFYRPAGIKMTTSDAYRKVEWRIVGGDRVEIQNNSPFYITYNQARVNNRASADIEMIAPFGKTTVRIPGAKKGDKVQWQVVTDHGGVADGDTILK